MVHCDIACKILAAKSMYYGYQWHSAILEFWPFCMEIEKAA
jgi:hypothetical protein